MAATCAAAELTLPDGPGRALVYGQCRTCHDLQYLIESKGVPRDTWNELLDSMKQYGLRIDDHQRAQILDYLATYLGPNPPPATATAATAGQPAAGKADGASIFRDQCAACHQPDGRGLTGQFPPLAGNPDLFLGRDYPARVVLAGLSGKIEVEGQGFDSVMPSFGVLGDEDIAAVVNFIRGAWGNDALSHKTLAPLDGGAVATRRAKAETPQQVHAARAQLKAAAAPK
ncbi:MAG TPA: cytochrome c [Caldimonas sp.]|nr:cytochrome c [Caldimonas sp.]